MNASQVTFVFYLVAIGFTLGIGLWGIVGNFLYEIRTAKLIGNRKRHPFSKKLRQRPVISVVVYSKGNSGEIENCLKSVVNSSYRKLEVIVVDNVSKDMSKNIVRQYITNNPSKCIRLVAKRVEATEKECLDYVIKKVVNGEFVLNLTTQQRLEKNALKLSIMRFNEEHNLSSVILNKRVEFNYTLKSFWNLFIAALTAWILKTDRKSKFFADFGIVRRRQVLTKARNVFSEEAIIFDRSVNRSVRSIFGYAFYCTLLLQLLVIPFLLYISVTFSNPTFFVADLLIIGVLGLIIIWNDLLLSAADRIMLSINLPFLLGAFVLNSIWRVLRKMFQKLLTFLQLPYVIIWRRVRKRSPSKSKIPAEMVNIGNTQFL